MQALNIPLAAQGLYQIGMTARTLLLSLRAAAFAGVLFVAFAAAVPFLVEGQAIRRQLEDRLAEMTGGEVESMGRVRLASFIALTVEVEDIRLRDITRLGPVSSVDARSLKAIIGFGDLLFGGPGFSKLILANVDIRLAHDRLPEISSERIPELLRDALEAAGPQVDTIRVRDARLSVEGQPSPEGLAIASLQYEQSSSGRRWLRVQTVTARDRVTFQMRSRPSASGHDVSAALRGPGFHTAFAGRLEDDARMLAGAIHLALTDPAAFDAAAGPLVSGRLRVPADISGSLHFLNGGWSLDEAALRLGRSSGAGYLTLRNTGGRFALDGTVSWSLLDLNDLHSLFQAVRGPGIDGDLRISADRVDGLPMALGPAAAAVTVKQGRVTADVAELVLYGGSARGRIEAELAGGQILALGATVEDVNIRELASAFGIEPPLTGRADIRADLRATVGGEDDESGSDGLAGSLRITAPGPAAIPAPLSQRISAAFGAATPPLSLPGALSINAIKIDVTLLPGNAGFRLTSELTDGGQLLASGTISRPTKKLRGEIEVQRPSLLTAALLPPADEQSSRIVLSGSLGELQFLSREAGGLSN